MHSVQMVVSDQFMWLAARVPLEVTYYVLHTMTSATSAPVKV
jgi:hypothetical protein